MKLADGPVLPDEAGTTLSTDRGPVLSWLTPASWGYSAAASPVDVRHLVPATTAPQEQFGQHTRHFWLLETGMLVGLTR